MRSLRTCLCGFVLVAAARGGAAATVEALTCEYLVDPIGIDAVPPRLSWRLVSAARGERQTAYQVLAARSLETLAKDRGDLWDSGKVQSDRSVHVEYAGAALSSRLRCHWKVRVWDKDGRPSAYSAPAFFEMGLLAKDDWHAKWVSAPAAAPGALDAQPSPFFRKAFAIEKPVARARAYVCGLGYYELYLNGAKVGDHVLDPAFTRYDRRVLYVTYDVTAMLVRGANAAGVVLGNGWYNPHVADVWDFHKAPWRARPVMCCQIEATFEDGSRAVVASDESWKVATGPILYDAIRNGETYDARRELPSWCSAACDDGGWSAAQVVAGPKGVRTAQMLPPIKVMQTLAPAKIAEPAPGVFVVDLGQNIAGWAQLSVRGPAGTKVVMKYAERLAPRGTIDQKDIGPYVKQGEFQTDTYILKGEGVETWEPRFAYHGFQYVQIAGFPGAVGPESVRGRVVHTSFERAGSFECSNELLNRIQRATLWAYVGNFHGYPTDCPHREKNGWTGDAHLAAEQGLLNFAPQAAYTKWMDDLYDEQRESGELPGIVPTGGWGYAWGNGPAWDSAYVLIPRYLYEYAGDARILARHFERHTRYVDYLTSKAKDGIVGIGLGDWAPAHDTTPEKVTSTGYYYADALVVARTAELLGKTEDARKYFELAEGIKKAFNREFFDAAKATYANGTQTALSCALYQGFVEPADKSRVVGALVAHVLEQRKGHLDAGILGTKYLLHALSDNGRTDVAWTIATQTTFPSWGDWLAKGATTLWEQWNGNDSRNHIMYGDVSAWFYKNLAGLKPDPEGPGFKKFIAAPQLAGDLAWARAEHRGPYGDIRVAWRKDGRRLTLEVLVPPNSEATVSVPAAAPAAVTESGAPLASAQGVKVVRTESGTVVVAVGAGAYAFESRL